MAFGATLKIEKSDHSPRFHHQNAGRCAFVRTGAQFGVTCGGTHCSPPAHALA
jgi:hypothetical protein